MGLVADLGLERFFYGRPAEDRYDALVALVQTGCCELVREVVTEDGHKVSSDTPILEARRVGETIVTRMLDADQAAPILEEVREVFADTGSYAPFSWEQLEEVGADDLQALAVCFDIDDDFAQFETKIGGDRQRVVSLDRSQRNFLHGSPLCEAAWALHWLARRHRLVVHCA